MVDLDQDSVWADGVLASLVKDESGWSGIIGSILSRVRLVRNRSKMVGFAFGMVRTGSQ